MYVYMYVYIYIPLFRATKAIQGGLFTPRRDNGRLPMQSRC